MPPPLPCYFGLGFIDRSNKHIRSHYTGQRTQQQVITKGGNSEQFLNQKQKFYFREAVDNFFHSHPKFFLLNPKLVKFKTSLHSVGFLLRFSITWAMATLQFVVQVATYCAAGPTCARKP
jgi:hypothetical protein